MNNSNAIHIMLKFTFFALLSLLLSGCATIKTGSHHDESVSFDRYRSFGWIAENPLMADGSFMDPLIGQKIIDAIKLELTKKGFSFVTDRETADMLVGYTIGTRDRLEVTSYPSAHIGPWGFGVQGRYYYETEVEHRMYTEGTLGVDIFDSKTKQSIWHGWATKSIQTSDQKNPSPVIKMAVSQLLARFPPVK